MATKKKHRAIDVKGNMEYKSAAASARNQTVMLSVTLVLMKMKTLIMFIMIEGRLKVRMRISVPLRYTARLSFIIPVKRSQRMGQSYCNVDSFILALAKTLTSVFSGRKIVLVFLKIGQSL
ncbi:hypothetical protein PoB_005329000 [Plakobranchus ocellatus]|uniref:Uncharacterized protein n=1 Tax=Plakobranchus ocellatus TaxID=259542 RepID=A0AAV4C288_9GAST|nr:hypothetical protein PoB_005329000 [Plakobranchus ocellatus]